MEKSADGWWTGRLNGGSGVVGVFPASFVEEIQEPGSKEEFKRFKDKTRSLPARDPVVETQTVGCECELLCAGHFDYDVMGRGVKVLHHTGLWAMGEQEIASKHAFPYKKTPQRHVLLYLVLTFRHEEIMLKTYSIVLFFNAYKPN